MAKACNEGINDALSIILQGTARPSFFLGIYKNSTEPLATATLADLTEPSGAGYARIQLLDADWTEALQAGTNLLKTFACSGGVWGNCYGCFICTAASGTAGKLYFVEQFSDGPYNITDGGAVKVTPKVLGS